MTRLPLRTAAIAFLAANLLHTLDHLRQGIGDLTTEILAGGAVITVGAVVTLYLILRDDPRAALTATVVGLWAAAGVSASHLAPHWSAFSDSYPEIGVDPLSWAAVLAEIGAALALGLLGLREVRRQAAPGSWLSSST